jgi:hypothetical protein
VELTRFSGRVIVFEADLANMFTPPLERAQGARS